MRALKLHEILFLLRNLLFLLLPVITHILPPAPPLPSPALLMNQTRGFLEHTFRRLGYLKFLNAAVWRDPLLRDEASEWWDRQRVRGAWVREDDDVKRLAEKLGSGYAERGAVPDGSKQAGGEKNDDDTNTKLLERARAVVKEYTAVGKSLPVPPVSLMSQGAQQQAAR